jgi:hypothetical protein
MAEAKGCGHVGKAALAGSAQDEDFEGLGFRQKDADM